MNVSAINCTPIKPRSFGREMDDQRYGDIIQKTSDLNDELVKSSDIKKPEAILASIALAGVVAYASGRKLANITSHIVKGAPEKLEAGLKKASTLVLKGASKLSSVNPDAKIVKEGSKLADKKAGTLLNKIKIGKIANLAGSALEKAEGIARKAYTKIAYAGITEETTDKAAEAMRNVMGAGAVATVVPTVLGRDGNGDGVSDILQRGQNAYTGTQTRMAGTLEKAKVVADIVETLS